MENSGIIKKLPSPDYHGDTSLEEAFAQRRSVREYQDGIINLGELSQLLWSALGVTQAPNRRTIPSAGALNPLELCVVVGYVEGLQPGVYRHNPHKNSLIKILPDDQRQAVYRAALEQDMILQAAVVLVISAIYERTTVKYGERGVRYAHMEVGAAAQNVALQCVAMGLGTVYVGAFRDEEIKQVLGLPENEHPLCLLPIGIIPQEPCSLEEHGS